MSTIKITEENFEQEVLQSAKPILVDFYADWCMPCQALAPVLESLSGEISDFAKIGKANVNEQAELAERFRIHSVPTMLLFSGGTVIDTLVGAAGKEQLLSFLNSRLSGS